MKGGGGGLVESPSVSWGVCVLGWYGIPKKRQDTATCASKKHCQSPSGRSSTWARAKIELRTTKMAVFLVASIKHIHTHTHTRLKMDRLWRTKQTTDSVVWSTSCPRSENRTKENGDLNIFSPQRETFLHVRFSFMGLLLFTGNHFWHCSKRTPTMIPCSDKQTVHWTQQKISDYFGSPQKAGPNNS